MTTSGPSQGDSPFHHSSTVLEDEQNNRDPKTFYVSFKGHGLKTTPFLYFQRREEIYGKAME